MRDGCPFCDYAGPSPILTEWSHETAGYDGCYAIEPLNPVTAGHVLIIPRRHLEDAIDDHAQTAAVFEAACGWIIENAVGDHNLIASAGAAATQTVRHLHVHVIPRRAGDGLALPWPRVDRLTVSDLCWVERRPGSVRVVLECDDELGAGFALERIRGVLSAEAIPADWLARVERQDFPSLNQPAPQRSVDEPPPDK